MRGMIVGVLLVAVGTADAAAGSASRLTVEQLFSVCTSTTVAAASAQGDALQWAPQSVARLAEWRTHFERYNGGSVEVVGWQRTETEAEGLAYWVATGPNGHRGCAYNVTDADSSMLAGLQLRLGAPDAVDTSPTSTVAMWKRGGMRVSFSRTGAAIYVNIAHEK